MLNEVKHPRQVRQDSSPAAQNDIDKNLLNRALRKKEEEKCQPQQAHQPQQNDCQYRADGEL